MFSISKAREFADKLDALNRSQAIIEFKMDGTIIAANKKFLDTMGYTLSEIAGRHHSILVDPKDRDTAAHRKLWEALNRGEYQAGEFRRIGKNGKEVWIQGSYNPILGRNGKPYKVLKFATDITDRKLQMADYEGQINAISTFKAVIQFKMDGTIITANDKFLAAVGYSLTEIKDRNDSMFVDPKERDSIAYRQFWETLNRGQYQSGEFRRVGKGGKELWIQATYTPIADLSGKPFKVVQYAADVTGQVEHRKKLEVVRQEFEGDIAELDGAVRAASEYATNAVGASAETSSNVQAVASGADELVASIGEISRQVCEALSISDRAVEQGNRTNEIVSGLTNAASRIGEVVNLINNIAGQTNLLALNATIEAARAGEAGRGFAVVASEVKALASQTAKATDEIAGQIANVQGATGDAAMAIEEITSTIATIKEISASIAAAVEEQTAVTRGMSANMQTAANGVTTISKGMNEIAAVTKTASTTSQKVREASRTLAQ